MREFIGTPFERLGGALIDPAMVVPASLPLDLCGESVRARLCVFTDHTNTDMALRPDLTLPVALAEIEARKAGHVTGEQVHRYAARAFRQPTVPGEPLEFLQVGFEQFGASSDAQTDARAYELVSEVATNAGVKRGVAQLGDLAIIPAFIDALELNPAVGAGLRRAFREAGGAAAYLDRASRPRGGFALELAGLSREDVAARFTAKLAALEVKHVGNRTEDEIVTQLIEQARNAEQSEVPERARRVLDHVLALQCEPYHAANKLRAIAKADGLNGVDPALDALAERLEAIMARAPAFMQNACFSPSFGRRFTYYDGFVFEIAEPGERAGRPFGAGGRYDHLLSDLSLGAVSASAIGGVVRPDRITLAVEAGL